MAGEWIAIRLDLATDPAVITIASQFDEFLDEDHVVGKLVRLWAWANQQTLDGNAHGVTKTWIDRYIGVTGFADALASVGWLTISETGISFPNFDRWNAQSAKRRLMGANRVQALRQRKKCNAHSVTSSVTKALPQNKRIRITGERHKKKKKSARALQKTSILTTKIYDAYPRKVGKAAALKAIEKALQVIAARGEADPVAWLLARVEAFARSPAGQQGTYTPYPASWFNQGRYDDADAEWNRKETHVDNGSAARAHSRERAEAIRRHAERDQRQFASDPGEATLL